MEVEIPEFVIKRSRTRTYDVKPDPTATLQAIIALICPAGTIIPTLSETQPQLGWLMCNGQSVLKSEYPTLYGMIGGQFGETAESFSLPDLRERMPIGAGGTLGMLATGGASALTLTIDQLPAHGHAITDPGHGHGFTPTPHGHTVTDPGHTHTVTDPGHTHGSIVPAAADAGAGADVGGTAAGSTDSALTGVSVDAATSGVSVDDATADGDVETAVTNIAVQETGGGQPIPILPPYIAVNWMVRT